MSKQTYRRKLISFGGYHGFRRLLLPGEILVIEYEQEESECTTFKRINNAREFKIINRIDGGDIFGIWAWKKDHFETFNPKEDSIYDLDMDRRSAHPRVMEDIVLMAIHERRNAWDVYRTVEDDYVSFSSKNLLPV